MGFRFIPARQLVAGLCCIALACASDTADTEDTTQPESAAPAPDITLRSEIQPITRAEDAMPRTFIPPYTECREPKPGETGSGPNGRVCTQVAISGATEPGKYFPDYGACDVVRTQRPFWPAPPAAEPSPNDPRLNDAAFMAELEWAKTEIEATGCTCCHDSRVNNGLVGEWDINRGPIWLDTLSDTGLALFAGLADSSSLGAYDRDDNYGFDRTLTGIPTTDTARMQAFLGRELERRCITEEEARAVPPFGGPIYFNRIAEPTACRDVGFGVDAQLNVQFGAEPARYVYVLAEGSMNPGVPPNLDLPEGTLWRLDVLPSNPPVASGVRYGTTPTGSHQVIPTTGVAPALEAGRNYQLYVLRDVGLPLANCWFTFGET